MPSVSTGTVNKNADGSFSARVVLQGKRITIPLPQCASNASAAARAGFVAQLAKQLTRSRAVFDEALVGLLRVANAKSVAKLEDACELVKDLIGGYRPPTTKAKPTFRVVAGRWLGTALDLLDDEPSLVDKYPGTIKQRAKTSIASARANLKLYILEVVIDDAGTKFGDLPVDEITIDHCDKLKHALPKALRADSRRQALMPLKTVLRLCVEPLRYITHSPLPAKWLPKHEGARRLQWLYPSEDLQLMRCTKVPLWARVLFGFLIREGTRVGETLDMTLAHFDLDAARGTASLDAPMTKTKRHRLWVLEPGTARALAAWSALARSHAQPSDRMFVDGTGADMAATRALPDLLRAYLKLAGVTRPQLYVTTADSRQLCVHDLRGSFVTVMLALDKSEAFISQRTGHMSSVQLRGYQRLAQTFAELKVGAFVPLDQAIPELAAMCRRAASASQKMQQSPTLDNYIVESGAPAQASDTTRFPRKRANGKRAGASRSDDAGTSLAAAALRVAALELQLEQLRAAVVRASSPADTIAAVLAALGADAAEPAVAASPSMLDAE